mgnify:CR=1 FL=1
MISISPKVSIGMPVYNGEKYLRESLSSLLTQSFFDFELIISDNASTDNTSDICLEFSAKDHRIKYFRQTENIGAWRNFKYVLDEAQAEYFMWSAADDIRSSDFVELNYNFLSLNSEYVASTCPNRFEGDNLDVSFSLNEDDDFKRYVKFFDYCWFSHCIFYSLIRINKLKECDLLQESTDFFGIDWGVNIFLAFKGKINLTDKGYTFFGNEGMSKRPDHHKRVRISYIEYLIPFYKLSMYVIYLSKSLSLLKRARIINVLVILNIKVIYGRFRRNVKNLLIYFHLMQSKNDILTKN